jgi:hypothetical protein
MRKEVNHMDHALRRWPRALAIVAAVAVLALLVAVSARAVTGATASSTSDPSRSSSPPAFQPVQQQQGDPAPGARRDCPHKDGTGSGSGSGSGSNQSAPATPQGSSGDV